MTGAACAVGPSWLGTNGKGYVRPERFFPLDLVPDTELLILLLFTMLNSIQYCTLWSNNGVHIYDSMFGNYVPITVKCSSVEVDL
jgi:hypothetical protein